MKLRSQGESAAVGGCEKAAAVRSHRSKSPRLLHQRLPQYGRRHEGGASGSREIELPSGSLASGAGKEAATISQRGSPPLLSREAYGLLRDAEKIGLGVVAAEPFKCSACPLKFGREKTLRGHMRSVHRQGCSSPSPSSSSSSEAPTPKKSRKKPKPKQATVKTEPHHDDPPLPFPLARAATSRSHQVGDVLGEKLIEDDTSDDGNANPVAAVTGFGAVAIASSAPDPAAVLPVARAPAAAIEVIVLDADSSNDDKPNPTIAVTGIGAVARVVAPIAADTVKGNDLQEAGARYSSNGGDGKAVAGYRSVSHGKAAAGYSSGGYGHGKAITIGGQSKRGLGNTGYSCDDCGETFPTPQGLEGHVAGHKHKKSKATPDLQSNLACQSSRHVCMACNKVLPTGQALGWHMKLHYAGLMIGVASDAGSSSARRPAAAAADEEPSEAIAMNINPEAVHGSAGAMRGWSFPASARSAILALPALMSPVHDPPQGMAMAGNPVVGPVSAPTPATGSSSLPAITSSVLPAQISGAPGNRGGRTFRIFGVHTFPAFPSQNQEENPPEVAVVPGNGEHLYSFNISPPFPSQNPPETVPVNRGPEGVAVAPAGNIERSSIYLFGSDASPAFPSQNQEENPPLEMVPSNHGSRTIRLFGVNMAEGPKEMKK
ncbi:hypothetical protein PVAP13_8NG183100 [Panicum virgatum]|uniref:C2H2-type domain-containing protein n=1 Tax=Panicum virgatum TaxID=38727 RepID=A0A8T0P8W2_PANVG|nr:hypothetical protein PVAP13_8NG183100 [Panicum virgatum]